MYLRTCGMSLCVLKICRMHKMWNNGANSKLDSKIFWAMSRQPRWFLLAKPDKGKKPREVYL
jgi:hypothetical protein